MYRSERVRNKSVVILVLVSLVLWTGGVDDSVGGPGEGYFRH